MKEILEQFTIWSAIDILIIAIVIYQGLLLLRGTRAAQMLTGVLVIIALFLASSMFPFSTLHWLLSKLYPSLLLIIIILFQDDIRHVLSTMGKKPLIQGAEASASGLVLDEICRAAVALAAKRIGALMVIERAILLTRYVDVGIQVDARVSKELLMSIFHPSSPIHDGAVIIQRGRITSAGCFLPLTKDENVDPNMGTRHRAAIGISQETDAVVILVSEEGASVAIVENGRVTRKPDGKMLREDLFDILLPDSEKKSGGGSKVRLLGHRKVTEVISFFRGERRMEDRRK